MSVDPHAHKARKPRRAIRVQPLVAVSDEAADGGRRRTVGIACGLGREMTAVLSTLLALVPKLFDPRDGQPNKKP